jgi:hypothetical protein
MDDKLKLYVIVGIGLAAMCYAFVLWFRLRRCSSWPSTDGTIIRSDKTISRHNFQKIEKVTIRYTYFAGSRYESETVKVGGFMHVRARDQNALLLRYPLGKAVQVYYDPDRPQVACLEKRGLDSILIIGGYGCFALVIGLLLYFLHEDAV